MNYKFCLLTIIFVSLFVSCSKTGNSKSNEVVIDDRPSTSSSAAAKNVVVIDDKLFTASEDNSPASPNIPYEPTKTNAADQSKIDTSFDGFGNKSESRYFNNNPRLKFVLLRTAADGQKQIFVYGQNGQVKNLPENMIDRAMTATADELANSAGIFETVRQSAPAATVESRNNTPLRPLPSYNFPVQTRPVETAPAQENIQITEPTGEKSEAGDNEKKKDASLKEPGKDL